MPLLLKFHGALDVVTGSCHFFKIKASDNVYAVDCGAAQGEGSQDQPANPGNMPLDCKPEKLSGILLTHAHGDHINHLPRWFAAGFRGTIYCTEETAKLAEISLQDSRRIEDGKGFESPGEKAFQATLDALRNATHVQPGRQTTLEHNVTIEAAMTSHLLGCCAFRIEATHGDKKSSVLYTGDIGPVEHEDETRSLYAERKRPEKPSDFVVSESTYGNRPRSAECQSGLRRQERVCQMLAKAFRHGDKSVVFIPAFSLQRSLDVLTDVFCALHYQRQSIGLSNSSTPLIVVHSNLSHSYAEAYRDIYYEEQRSGNLFFNEKSLLMKCARDAEDDADAIFDNLLPRNRGKVIRRHDESYDPIATEIRWGEWDKQDNRPTVVICASGMTHTGPIVELMGDYLDKEHATFALCGYVPPSSPGGQLRELAPLSREARSARAIKLPKDLAKGRLEKIVSGDEVKCGFESISEYYSGHADGASIIRYILGDKLERTESTKGIFLVHGDRSARNELAQLIASTCGQAGKATPIVCRPQSHLSWFDCETCQLTDMAEGTPTAGENWAEQMSHRPSENPAESKGIPDTIELESCVILSHPGTTDDVLGQLEAAFDFARPARKGNQMLLKISRPGRPHSTVMLTVSHLAEGLLKIAAESRLMQVMSVAEIAEAALDWRRVLNVLNAPKELYFAGAHWALTDSEIDRLKAACEPSVYGNRQRRQPVLILHSAQLDEASRHGIERLLTPAVFVAVVEDDGAARINEFLKLTAETGVSRTKPIYLPLKAPAGAQCITTESGHIDIKRLTDLVTADTLILNAREPQLLGSGKPSALASPTPEKPKAPAAAASPGAPRTKVGTERLALPIETFMELAAGQKLTGKVEHIQAKRSSGSLNFAIIRLSEPNVTGILHHTCMTTGFTANIGDELIVWVRNVVPERRNVFLSQFPMRLPAETLLQRIKASPSISPSEIAEIIGKPGEVAVICRAADESYAISNKQHELVKPETALDAPRAIDAYNRAVHELQMVEVNIVHAPEPIQGPTYGDVAKELGYTLTDLVNAAGHMISTPTTFALGMAVLPNGFNPTETSPFPAEHREAFVKECLERSKDGWAIASQRTPSEITPDCHSIAELARLLGIPQPTLLVRLEEKGIKPEVRVVVTPDDIRKLIG